MFRRDSTRRTLASYVPPYALSAGTRTALKALGYAVVPATTLGRFDDPDREVDLRLAEARLLQRLPSDDTPVILLGSGREPIPGDPRVVACVPRPAEVATLYPLLQRALEPHPRRAARATAHIPGHCTRAGRRWSGRIVRLSQVGCLFHCAPELSEGMELNVSFPLPPGRTVSIRARVSTRLAEGAGLAFRAIPAPAAGAIGEYVQRRLATGAV